MSLEKEIALAHGACPCVEKPWAAVNCRNCATTSAHSVELCEWRGHAAINRVVEITRFDAMERIKVFVDKDPAMSVEVRKVLQSAA